MEKIFSEFITLAVIVASLSMFDKAVAKLEQARITANSACASQPKPH